MINILHIARGTRKALKKGEMKKEKYEKRLTAWIKFFTFIFVYGKIFFYPSSLLRT